MSKLVNPIEFLKISTYPGLEKDRYMIGGNGSVYDINLDRFKELNPHKSNGYVYGKFKTSDGNKKTIGIHRLVAYDHVEGYCEETGKIYVDHNNFKRSDNSSDNLEWVTSSENNKRRYNNEENIFTNPPIYRGTEHPNCKNNVETIIKICELLAEGKSIIETFYYFGYNAQSENKNFYNLIYDIKNKKSWAHISNNYF